MATKKLPKVLKKHLTLEPGRLTVTHRPVKQEGCHVVIDTGAWVWEGTGKVSVCNFIIRKALLKSGWLSKYLKNMRE